MKQSHLEVHLVAVLGLSIQSHDVHQQREVSQNYRSKDVYILYLLYLWNIIL